ncbi:MAG: serine/threonine protein kinase [Leptolyngbyaceae cyanobacterium SL_7_1]|nr:serine/threonine protein kinase [Leptolyngbyaceae cyanobacterium SL_7_1]
MEISTLSDRYDVKQTLSKKPGRQSYLALDRQTQDFVIVKVLIFSYDFDWDDLKLFEREATILRTLNHPAIPRYRDSFELDLPNFKGFALVQDYIDAKSLEMHLQAGRTFDETEIKQIAEAVLEVLIYLHQQNPPVIHRDIKPSNILLANRSAHSTGQVYVVDFGSVQNSVFTEGSTWTITGTYGYAPLEQFSGRAVPACDLYALGATLIHLVTGQHPADLLEQDLQIQFDQTIAISFSLKRWLRRMTEPSLKQRFSSTQEALQTLNALQSDGELVITNKPIGSKIVVTKNPEELQILIPPMSVRSQPNRPKLLERARKSSLFPSFVRSLPTPLLIIVLIVFGIYYAVIGLLMFLIPILGWLLFAVVATILLFAPFIVVFSYSRLRLQLIRNGTLEQDYIVLCREFLGLQLSRSTSRLDRAQIRIQVLNQIMKTYRADNINCYSILSELIIWVDNQKYVLGNLTPLELDWLSQELSDWLNLPIERCEIPMIQRVPPQNEDTQIRSAP